MNANAGQDYRTRMYEEYAHLQQEPSMTSNIAAWKPRMPLFRKILREHFPVDKNINILDLGCGQGAFLYACREAGYRSVFGVDRSPWQVGEAQKQGIEGVRKGDILETIKSLSDATQDRVITFDVLEHFTKAEALIFADEVFRVLRQGGKWIIHAPNGESLFAARVRYGDFTHETIYTRISITQLLKAARFSVILCQEDAPIPHGFKSAVRWLLWKIIRGVLRLYLVVETGAGGRENIFSQNFLTVGTKSF